MKMLKLPALLLGSMILVTSCTHRVLNYDKSEILDDRAIRMSAEKTFNDKNSTLKLIPQAELFKSLNKAPKNFPVNQTISLNKNLLTPTEIFNNCADSVVAIFNAHHCKSKTCKRWHAGTSSGVVVDSSGLIVTNYHVMNSKDGLSTIVRLKNGKIFPVIKVLAADKDADLALIKIDATELPALPVAPNLDVGESVYTISHPLSRFYMFTQGMVARHFTLYKGPKENLGPRMSITADYAAGSSGAPVLDACGNVVGLISSTMPMAKDPKKTLGLQMIDHICVPASSINKLLTK